MDAPSLETIARALLHIRHPDWVDHAWAMTELAERWGWMGKTTKDPYCILDDLYHVASNAPGCAAV